MKELWEVCRTAQKPAGYLMVKISELERGVFTGAAKLDRQIASFAMKFKLEDSALGRLIEVMKHRADTKSKDLRELERCLKSVSNPSREVMPLLQVLRHGGRLPSPRRSRESRSRRCSRSRSRAKSSASSSRSRVRSRRS